MAQHIPTSAFKQKAFRTIEHGVREAFKRTYGMKTSMRYAFVNEQDGAEVYLTMRSIPKGIVHGTDTGNIEVHYDPIKKEVREIYLVA